MTDPAPVDPVQPAPTPDWQRKVTDHRDYRYWCEIKFDGRRWRVRLMCSWHDFRPNQVNSRKCRTEEKAQQVGAQWMEKLANEHEGWSRAR